MLALTDSAASGRIFAPHRRVFWAITTGVVVVLAVVFTIETLSAIFAVELPGAGLLALAIGTGLVGGGWTALRHLWPARTSEHEEGIAA